MCSSTRCWRRARAGLAHGTRAAGEVDRARVRGRGAGGEEHPPLARRLAARPVAEVRRRLRRRARPARGRAVAGARGGRRELGAEPAHAPRAARVLERQSGRSRRAMRARASSSPSSSARASAARLRCARSSTRTSGDVERARATIDESPREPGRRRRRPSRSTCARSASSSSRRKPLRPPRCTSSRALELAEQLRHPRAGRLPRARRSDRGADHAAASSSGPPSVLAAFEAQSRASRVPWSLATGARCRGLLLAAHGELEAAEHRVRDGARASTSAAPCPSSVRGRCSRSGGLQRRRNERRRAQESLDRGDRGLRAGSGRRSGCAACGARAAPARRAPDERAGLDRSRAARRRAGRRAA